MSTNQTAVIEYSAREEFLHALTHGVGAFLSLFAILFLVMKAGSDGAAANRASRAPRRLGAR